jgi:hypothetical protein
MSTVTIDRPTGALLIEGRKVFPIVFSNPPPPGGRAPSGRNALAELAAAGANFIRTGLADWSLELADGQIAAQRALLEAAGTHGLRGWVWLGDVANLPRQAGSTNEQLLVKIVNALKGHPALGAWKGIDEPANPLRPARVPRPASPARLPAAQGARP